MPPRSRDRFATGAEFHCSRVAHPSAGGTASIAQSEIEFGFARSNNRQTFSILTGCAEAEFLRARKSPLNLNSGWQKRQT